MTAQSTKLPVWATVKQSYVLTFQNLAWFARMAWLWLLAFVAVVATIYWIYFPYETPDVNASWGFWATLQSLPSLLIGSSLAVAWHRRLLAGDTAPSHGYFRLDQTVIKYFGWLLLFLLLFFLPLGLTIALVSASASASANDEVPASVMNAIYASVIAGIALAYIQTRISLLLPALALGHADYGAKASWAQTKGNGWRLLLGTALTFVVPYFGLLLPVVALDPYAEPETRLHYVMMQCLFELSYVLIGMISITFLSLAYRHFNPLDEHGNPVSDLGSDTVEQPAH